MLLRLLIGLLFLVAGLGKFGGLAGFREYLNKEFAQTILAGPLLTIFGHVLPFAEVAIGALVLLGLFTRPALALAAFTLVALFFGKMLVRDAPTMTAIGVYFLITVYALRNSDENRFALDSLLCQHCCHDEKPAAG